MTLRVTMLGTGTSSGVPVIGCECPVCTSEDPRNRRLRCALRIEWTQPAAQPAKGEGTLAGRRRVLLVDTPPDLRQQALRFGLDRVDGILFTHAHADHIHGLDDVRVFNFRQGGAIPCFGSAETLEAVRRAFSYVFEPDRGEGGGKPRLETVPVREPFELWGRRVEPVPVCHGSMEVYGYRVGSFAYVTDCKEIPPASRERLRGLDLLILDALRYRPHSTHLSLEEAVEVARGLGARRTVFTHLSHEVDHGAVKIPLPPDMELGYDGLTFEISCA